MRSVPATIFGNTHTSLIRFAFALVLAGAVALYTFGDIGTVSAQGVPLPEICNGKDDNGDGHVDEGLRCDHYLTYLLDQTIQPISVVLRDQFINPTDFTLTLIERLFNPVKKIHAGLTFRPQRPDLHYLAYRLQSNVPFSPRSVFIANQFEQRQITVTKPRYLLTPTGKRKLGIPVDRLSNKLIAALIPPVPQNANHYLCYDIEPYTIARGVTLQDQFQNRKFEVLRALYLCNPAEKRVGGKVYPIVGEQDHLLCYEVQPHNAVNRPVITRDQFGVRGLKPARTEEVCVPTRKQLLACTQPDVQGTAVVFDKDKHYRNTDGQLTVAEPTPTSDGLTADALLRSGPETVITQSGSALGGEIYQFQTEILELSLSNGRVLTLPVNGEIRTNPRTPGTSPQSFDTDMRALQGQLPPGDPDFDLLRITAGGTFGLPSPGHTTLTQLPGGTWAVDSFFDITYRIDFVGAPGGPLAGHSGSTTGTIRMQVSCNQPAD